MTIADADTSIEKVWRHGKSTCVAAINHNLGTRCGYCSVSMAHPFFRKNYMEDSISDLKHKIDDILMVHGGVTYSGKLDWALAIDKTLPRNQWWFGFDCFHGHDMQDYSLIRDPKLRKLFENISEDLKKTKFPGQQKGSCKSLGFVEENCNNLAEYLARFMYNSVDFIISEDTSHLQVI